MDLKEGLQNTRYLNQNATETRNKKPSTKNIAVTDLINTDDEVTAETETRELAREQDLQNCDFISDNYFLSDVKLVYTCIKLVYGHKITGNRKQHLQHCKAFDSQLIFVL